jgi:hypothetical protein
MARALWQIRFAPNLDELVAAAFVGSVPRRHRRNRTARREVEEVAHELAAAASQFNRSDDSFEEF